MTEFATPSPELVRILIAMSEARADIVIQGKRVGLDCTGRYLGDNELADKFFRQLTAHQAEILAVFGPDDKVLDWEFLQDFVRPVVTRKLFLP
jgi:hypothetical protein